VQRVQFEIPYYHDYISSDLAQHLLRQAKANSAVPGLQHLQAPKKLETTDALEFLIALYNHTKTQLAMVLAQRQVDRDFIDARVKAYSQLNSDFNIQIDQENYQTVLGIEDGKGRIVFGPLQENFCEPGGAAIAELPAHLLGPHVTLFGPPDSAKLSINAMNAFHRKLSNESPIVTELVEQSGILPKWGADDEDSKTPLHEDLADAAENLKACYDGTLRISENGKLYQLESSQLSLPIKRFPGLALPCTFLFYKQSPIPLHLYDFAMHLYHNWQRPEALTFYVPKLENEEEAGYISAMVAYAEKLVQQAHPSYKLGTVRLMIVLENPRAILRAHEIIDNLYPYFAGASLGWHDYLASTARLFKEDKHYRIPVKADPNIVIKYIKASHHLVADVVGSRGGIKVGGMYGILPTADLDSLQITLRGFIKDVVTQLKRNLNGFWVAHPDFVRLGIALVQAWKLKLSGQEHKLTDLVKALLDSKYHQEVLNFIAGPDIEGIPKNSKQYVRSLIVADIKESDFIANNHPDEIRYNVFQSLQYLTDWLSGRGCVALPTSIHGIQVRVMDDLATAERSRWEVWHEIYHQRFSIEDFVRIAFEEMNFIRRDLSDSKKTVQVKWDERTEKWYPVAFKIMLQLMTAKSPAEFATELLLPFTVAEIRNSADPMAVAKKLDPKKYQFDSYIEKYEHYFEICGVDRFAKQMAKNPIEDLKLAERIFASFSENEIVQAASFHGDIGQSKKTLDSRAASEQALVLQEQQQIKDQLASLAQSYRQKYGFKFLISAQGKTAAEILVQLELRLQNTKAIEIQNANAALWEISKKRLNQYPNLGLDRLLKIKQKHKIDAVSIAINCGGHTQTLDLSQEIKYFQLASLSKTIASAFAMEYFRKRNIPIWTSVNSLLAKTASTFRLSSEENSSWADQVTLSHLMSHSALNMHYVNGFPISQSLPPLIELLQGKHGYEKIKILHKPGDQFKYSGGGFLVLEHLISALEERPCAVLVEEFLQAIDIKDIRFDYEAEGALIFPGFAAGAFGTSTAMAKFLIVLEKAFHNINAEGLSHDTAVEMLFGQDKGCQEFMACNMGLGVFVAEAGENRLAIHQGANDGFRALYVHCFKGPDRGKGFVILCTGDNPAVPMIAEMALQLFKNLKFSGVSFEKESTRFVSQGIVQEEIVNRGYKELIFSRFSADLPEPILNRGPKDPLADFSILQNAQIESVTNQKFARAENLFSPFLPIFDPELFGRQGKVMDSWESARHNPRPGEELILRLQKTAAFRFVHLSTKYHDGNQAPTVSVSGWNASQAWQTIVEKFPMQGHAHAEIDLLKSTDEFSKIKIEIFPDGGLSRVGLYSEVPEVHKKYFVPINQTHSERYTDAIPQSKKPLTLKFSGLSACSMPKDLASAANGAELEHASNQHYGPAAQVISPFPPLHMFDGLESARSRKTGHFEEVILRLAKPSAIGQIILDFQYFVNNNPNEIAVEGLSGGKWFSLVDQQNVKAFAGNQKQFSVYRLEVFEKIRVLIFPDGGINRIKVFAPSSAV
jgi:malate synthase